MARYSVGVRYYSRVFVPVDLRLLIGREEIRKSRRTSVYRDARILTGKWEGRLAELFTRLRCRGVSTTIEQIKRLVQTHIEMRHKLPWDFVCSGAMKT